MSADSVSNGMAAAKFVASIFDRPLPPEVLEEARKCLVDWCAVALGARADESAHIVRRVVDSWQTKGDAFILLGGQAAPAVAAMVNGTLAHCLDFDDTHVASVGHFSGPTWAATLALGSAMRAAESHLLAAFVAGFEVGARLGSNNFGVMSNARGWHSTGIFGCLAAAAAAAALMRLPEAGVLSALGAAATQASGLTASFGTMSKPLHAGKAAFNGIFAAELAAAGFSAAPDLFEPGRGLGSAIVQDNNSTMPRFDQVSGWEIQRNTFKPYACCLLTHAAVDAARGLSARVQGRPIERVTARVNPLTLQIAGKPAPASPMEAKFSTAYCVAIGLLGHNAAQADFCDELVNNEVVRALLGRTELLPGAEFARTAAEVRVRFADGGEISHHVPLAKGNPGNPMSWDDLWSKFSSLVEPVLGKRTEKLFDVLRQFDRAGQLQRLVSLVSASAPG